MPRATRAAANPTKRAPEVSAGWLAPVDAERARQLDLEALE